MYCSVLGKNQCQRQLTAVNTFCFPAQELRACLRQESCELLFVCTSGFPLFPPYWAWICNYHLFSLTSLLRRKKWQNSARLCQSAAVTQRCVKHYEIPLQVFCLVLRPGGSRDVSFGTNLSTERSIKLQDQSPASQQGHQKHIWFLLHT